MIKMIMINIWEFKLSFNHINRPIVFTFFNCNRYRDTYRDKSYLLASTQINISAVSLPPMSN